MAPDSPPSAPPPRRSPAMGEEGYQKELQALRDSWRFAAFVQFCRLFEEPLRLRSYSSDTLEGALMFPEEHNVFLSEMLFKLLMPDRKKEYRPEDADRWEGLLQDRMAKRWQEWFESNPLEAARYYEIAPMQRLEILYVLADRACQESVKLRESVKSMVEDPAQTSDVLRASPIGADARGNRYYLFANRYEDCRVYKEEILRKSKSRKKGGSGDAPSPQWRTVCSTIDQLEAFVDKFHTSRNGNERALYAVLSNEVLPEMQRSEKARRRAEERAAQLEAAPLKRSTRIKEILTRRELEDRRRAEEEGLAAEDERAERQRREREMRLHGRHDAEDHLFNAMVARRAATGPSREERMRLREQKREMAELEEGLGGKRKSNWCPLGPGVRCPKRSRVHKARAAVDISKLVAVVREQFCPPMQISQPWKHHQPIASAHLPQAPTWNACFSQHGGLRQTPPGLSPCSRRQGLQAGLGGIQRVPQAAASMLDRNGQPPGSAQPADLWQQQLLMLQRQQQQQQFRQQPHQQQVLSARGAQRSASPVQRSMPLQGQAPAGAAAIHQAQQAKQQLMQQIYYRLPQAQKEHLASMAPEQRTQVLQTLLQRHRMRVQQMQQAQRAQQAQQASSGASPQTAGMHALQGMSTVAGGAPAAPSMNLQAGRNVQQPFRQQQPQMRCSTTGGVGAAGGGIKQAPFVQASRMQQPMSLGQVPQMQYPHMQLQQAQMQPHLSAMQQRLGVGGMQGAFLPNAGIRPAGFSGQQASPLPHHHVRMTESNGVQKTGTGDLQQRMQRMPGGSGMPAQSSSQGLVPVRSPAKYDNGSLGGGGGSQGGGVSKQQASGPGILNV